jgi:hypothetical protein
MVYRPLVSENEVPIRAIWLVISWGNGISTKTYFDWLCRFCVETGIHTLHDFEVLELENVTHLPTWRELKANKRRIIAQYLGRNSDGVPNFIEYAEAIMIDLCRHQIGNKCEQRTLMVEIIMQIRSTQGVGTPQYIIPFVEWMD